MGEILDQIGKLSPLQFENLAYDLLLSLGMKNLEWRTPGADGGRDIEGELIVEDFSKSHNVEKWHIECKRYTDSVPWPTIHEKVSYADTSKVNFLLLVTNSTPSPTCRDEIKKWNEQKRFPRIRCWDGVKLEELILKEKIIRLKYNLKTEKHHIDIFSSPLVEISTKTILSAYASEDKPSLALELAAALGDLLLSSYSEYEKGSTNIYKRTQPERDLYEWVLLGDKCDVSHFDPNGLRAMLCIVRFCGKYEKITLTQGNDEVELMVMSKTDLLEKSLAQISLISNIELRFEDKKLLLKSRKRE